LLACSDSDHPAAEQASCDDPQDPDVTTDTSTDGDASAPVTGTPPHPGPCTIERDTNLDGNPDVRITHTYENDRLSIVQIDSGADGSNDETQLYTYVQERVTQRTDVSVDGALLRTLRYAHDADGQLAYHDIHGPDDARLTRQYYMHLGATGIVAARNAPSTLIRIDVDEGVDGTVESYSLTSHDASGNPRRWRGYTAGALSSVQNVASRDARGNPLLVELDQGANGSVDVRSTHAYGCWTGTAFRASDPVQQTLLQATLHTDPANVLAQ
jgi:hypothetical protein